MRRKSVFALILVLSIVLSLAGCSKAGGNDKYRVVEELSTQSLCFGFRAGDKSGEIAIAAMKVLQADGTVSKLSKKWFGQDVSLMEGDDQALEKLGPTEKNRTFLVGYDPGRMPFSGMDTKTNSVTGFDPDLARAICDLLGWRIKFVPIVVASAEVELTSGNVDAVCGGFEVQEASTKINQSPVYMKNTIVVTSLAGSNVRSVGSLSGKTLNVNENPYYVKALEENGTVMTKAQFVVKVTESTEGCLKALDDGSCDATVTDLAALEYYR